MHISNRTRIEIAFATVAAVAIADAYITNALNRKAFKKTQSSMLYLADIIDRKQIPLTEFDEIALKAIADA